MANALADKEAQIRGYTEELEHKVRDRTRELRESEEKYRTIFESGSHGVFLLADVLLACNEQACRLWACSREDIIGKTPMDFSPPIQPDGSDSAEGVKKYISAALSGHPQQFYWCHVRKDGVPIDTEISLRSLTIGDRQVLLATMIDITDRRRAEEALAGEKKRLVSASSAGKVALWEWTIPTGKLEWSSTIDVMLGFAPGGFPRTIQAWTEILHPDDTPHVTEILDRHLEQDTVYDIDYRVRRSDGSYIWWHVTGSSERDQSGRAIRMAGACVDITDRKQAEEEVRILNAELEQRVRDRTAQLEAANKELEAFSYSVSHDLRAPLRAIDGFSRIILEDYINKLDDEGKRYLNVIRNNTQKMGQLIDDLLVFSRLGRQEIRVSDVDMGKMAKSVFREIDLVASGRKIQLDIRELPSAQGDQAMIRQVFANLLSNAIKFTRPKERTVIEVDGRSEGNENVYTVKDNGVGFDMQYANKLFGVFQRLHGSEEFEGTGVGLAIVQRIIHRHGGRIWAEGKVGEGASFYFTLPNR
jgi:PAS domain S-box-containing protein